jgi:hypothetical protein
LIDYTFCPEVAAVSYSAVVFARGPEAFAAIGSYFSASA